VVIFLKTAKSPEVLAIEPDWVEAFVVTSGDPSPSGRFANISLATHIPSGPIRVSLRRKSLTTSDLNPIKSE
jgi:hypothetical protein